MAVISENTVPICSNSSNMVHKRELLSVVVVSVNSGIFDNWRQPRPFVVILVTSSNSAISGIITVSGKPLAVSSTVRGKIGHWRQFRQLAVNPVYSSVFGNYWSLRQVAVNSVSSGNFGEYQWLQHLAVTLGCSVSVGLQR